jgi:Rrf2 family nitric oxide-sensitive transcriptional repressor
MRITSFTDYSLRALMYVARASGGRSTIAEAARVLAIPENHLVKVVHSLGKLGLLHNTRGRGGGFALARAPAAINLGEVLRATESLALAECFAEGSTCGLAGRCRLEGVLHEALDAFQAVLVRYTLEDLLSPARTVDVLRGPLPNPAGSASPQ